MWRKVSHKSSTNLNFPFIPISFPGDMELSTNMLDIISILRYKSHLTISSEMDSEVPLLSFVYFLLMNSEQFTSQLLFRLTLGPSQPCKETGATNFGVGPTLPFCNTHINIKSALIKQGGD